MSDLRDRELQGRLNSATKYPSIPAYHEMGARGRLSEPVVDFGRDMVSVSEKVDGTNARVIILPTSGQWVIGSRETLLSCSEDWIYNKQDGVVDELASVASKLLGQAILAGSRQVSVFFFEVYGGVIGQSWKHYTRDPGQFGHRLFDVIRFGIKEFIELMRLPRDQIAPWRDHGGQPFLSWPDFVDVAQETNLLRAPVLERQVPGWELPQGLQETSDWLDAWFPDGATRAGLSVFAGRPEGVVLKSHDHKVTAKLRFEDYRKTLKAGR